MELEFLICGVSLISDQSNNNKLPVIFFDIDGTLYNYEYSHEQGLRETFNQVWKPETQDSYEVFLEKYQNARQWVKRFLADTASVHSRALYFQRLCEMYLPRPDTDLILRLFTTYRDTTLANLKPFEGMYEVLGELQSRGYRLGVISNMVAEVQYQKLSRLQLNDYFHRIITSDEVGHEKPHPLVFSHALNQFDVEAQNAWMIGDSFNDDINGAGWLGMKTIWFNPHKHERPSESRGKHFFEAHNYEDILMLVEKNSTFSAKEGVIKYSLHFNKKKQPLFSYDTIQELDEYRLKAFDLKLIGVYPPNHPETPNIGFGNISQRYTADGQFIVTGSQTGDIRELNESHYPIVLDYNIEDNSLFAKGVIPPSSESLTHAAIYEVAPEVQFVLHVHHRGLWEKAASFGFVTTPPNVEYGTPAMGKAMQDVYAKTKASNQIVAMLGHEEGLIIWGQSPKELVEEIQKYLDKL